MIGIHSHTFVVEPLKNPPFLSYMNCRALLSCYLFSTYIIFNYLLLSSLICNTALLALAVCIGLVPACILLCHMLDKPLTEQAEEEDDICTSDDSFSDDLLTDGSPNGESPNEESRNIRSSSDEGSDFGSDLD